MTKMKKQRKGFTLTELAIVIAVIAILIAVLVPTFISLINKAKESNDSQLAKNMNTTLSTYAAINGDVDTPHEAISALKEDGYLIEKMTPTSEGYSYIWDESTNTVALIDSEFNFVYNTSSSELSTDEEDTTLWAIVSTQSQADTFIKSNYAFKYCVVATEEIEVDNSFDSYYAEDANVKLVADGDSYTMYTNGGEYTVNAPNATVEHYGTASLVNVTAVANNSYHVYGEVKMAVLTAGRLVVEEDATVSILAVTATNTTAYTITTKDDVDEAIGTIYTTVSSSSSSGTATTVKVNGTDTAAIESSSVDSLTSGITYVSTTSALEEFINSGTGMCVLKEDITISTNIALSSGKFMMIDLNNHTLTSTNMSQYSSTAENSDRNVISNKSELTISNGKLEYNYITGTEKAVFIIKTQSKMTLNNVEVATTGSFLLPYGDAAEVNVINSSITTTDYYCVATNAGSDEHYNVVINLQNSTFTTNRDDGNPVYINVAGTLNIDGCKIYGQRNGVIVRAGTATITNTVISCSIAASDITDNMKSYTTGTSWGSNPNTALGAVVVGNSFASSAYKADAVATLTGCSISYVITDDTNDADSQYEIALYVIQNCVNTDNYTTTVNVSNCTISSGLVVNYKSTYTVDTVDDSTTVTRQGTLNGFSSSYVATIYTTWVAAAGETAAHWE